MALNLPQLALQSWHRRIRHGFHFAQAGGESSWLGGGWRPASAAPAQLGWPRSAAARRSAKSAQLAGENGWRVSNGGWPFSWPSAAGWRGQLAGILISQPP